MVKLQIWRSKLCPRDFAYYRTEPNYGTIIPHQLTISTMANLLMRVRAKYGQPAQITRQEHITTWHYPKYKTLPIYNLIG